MQVNIPTPNIGKLIGKINGKKTYISIALYTVYRLAVLYHYMLPDATIETLLISAIGASAAHKVDKVISATEDINSGPTVIK